MSNRLRIIVLLLALVAGLTACTSMVGLGYSHADTVAAWQAEQYFDLEGPQKELFRDRFDRLHAWHRHEQLPDYVAFFGDARKRLQAGLQTADVDWFADGLRQRYRTVARRAAPDIAELLATLSPQQIEHLQRRWEKDNRKFAAEHRIHGSAEDRRRARAKRIVAQIKPWAGHLTAEQEARIAEMAADLPDVDRQRLEDRIRRQREFLQLLEHRTGDRAEFTQRLTHWLVDWERGRDAQYAKASDAAWRQRNQLFVATAALLTPEQRNHALQRMQTHIGEFRRLALR